MRLRPLDLVVVLAVLGLGIFAFSRFRDGGATGHVVLPDPQLAPGAINPEVTQANIGKTICVRGWTKTVRPPTSYTNALKLQQLRDYHLPGTPSDYQEDHLISLEMGGNPTDPRNLWPEPYPRASVVDKIENELNAKICSGQLSLAQARHEESALKHEHG